MEEKSTPSDESTTTLTDEAVIIEAGAYDKAGTTACECSFCITSRRYRKIIDKLEDPDDREFMTEFMKHFTDVSTSETYWRLKATGGLPDVP